MSYSVAISVFFLGGWRKPTGGSVRNYGHEHDFYQQKAENTDARTNYAVKYATARGHLMYGGACCDWFSMSNKDDDNVARHLWNVFGRRYWHAFGLFVVWLCRKLIHIPSNANLHGQVNNFNILLFSPCQSNTTLDVLYLLHPSPLHDQTIRNQLRNTNWYRKLPLDDVIAEDRIHFAMTLTWGGGSGHSKNMSNIWCLQLAIYVKCTIAMSVADAVGKAHARSANQVGECQNGVSPMHLGRCPGHSLYNPNE